MRLTKPKQGQEMPQLATRLMHPRRHLTCFYSKPKVMKRGCRKQPAPNVVAAFGAEGKGYAKKGLGMGQKGITHAADCLLQETETSLSVWNHLIFLCGQHFLSLHLQSGNVDALEPYCRSLAFREHLIAGSFVSNMINLKLECLEPFSLACASRAWSSTPPRPLP